MLVLIKLAGEPLPLTARKIAGFSKASVVMIAA
jgi:hypothetical protein